MVDRTASPPDWLEPELATLTSDRFSDPAWLYERKFDGERCLAYSAGGEVRLMTRNQKQVGGTYPELVTALAAQEHRDVVSDGEVVAFDGETTSFSRLQQRLGQHQPGAMLLAAVPVFFYVFDVLWLDGYDVRALGLRARKRLLRSALTYGQHLRLTPHRNEVGEAMFTQACRRGWEGVIAKRADSPYRDTRSRDWLKFKCEAGQELVIGGYTAPRGSRTEFGALLVGYFDGGQLRYAGKVGTGFDHATLASLGRRLRELERDTPPFADAASIREPRVTWAEPELVAQLAFTEWTRHGRLRHPRFLGLREDKPAAKVVREQ
jgi:bifunctional non-homologous end joining protein LigD